MMKGLLLLLLLLVVVVCITTLFFFGNNPHDDEPSTLLENSAFGADGVRLRAKILVSKMGVKEIIGLLHGIPNVNVGYTGMVKGVERLGIPNIQANDGPQGFRCDPRCRKSSTAFPCTLALGSSFDRKLARDFGEAIGEEFLDKGANMFLGPGVNLARIPLNGRTFEYVSGEDPFLGAEMVAPIVQGVQSKGVGATVKHFALNNQENNRQKVNVIVDERTMHELYLVPFRAAIDAGSVSIMCSYNLINGAPGCSSAYTMEKTLRKEWGFKGWVMSDWFATRDLTNSILNGLNQEMPFGLFYNDAALQFNYLANSTFRKLIRSRAEDVVTGMLMVNMEKNWSEKWNTKKILSNVTSFAHAQLARKIAANSIILLKNIDSSLPLLLSSFGNGQKIIIIIGDAAEAKMYVVGNGSGFVSSPYVISLVQGIRDAYEKTVLVLYFTSSQIEDAIKKIKQLSAIKYKKEQQQQQQQELIAVFVTVGLSSTEGADRKTLSLSNSENSMILQAATVFSKTIVIASIPGAILMDWSNHPNITSILVCFLCGQEFGHALADVISGRVNPSGRLPITFPNKDNEMNFTVSQYPGVNNDAHYSEGAYFGYRFYDQHKSLRPLFPFGFGLSYTTFHYSRLSHFFSLKGDRLIRLHVKNTGRYAGFEVVQLYLSFPDHAKKPIKVLAGFEKVFIEPGKTATVTFTMNPLHHLSVYDPGSSSWKVVHGKFQALVGSSSSDIRERISFYNLLHLDDQQKTTN